MHASKSGETVIVGSGDFQYTAIDDWPRLRQGWDFIEATSVAADNTGRVFVFNRGEHPVVVLDQAGNIIAHWGEGIFARPHGITITNDGSVWLTDDADHTVHKFTLEGRHLQTLGTSGRPSDTGADSIDFRSIKYAGPPFHFPTNVALAGSGEIYVTDGYGNARVHRFSPDGRLISSWGEPGAGEGQFHVPHGIAIDRDGVVYVADRENSRIQRFDADGRFIDQWNDIARPCQVHCDDAGVIYVAELGYRAGMWPGTVPPTPDATGGRVSIFDSNGNLLSRWGGGANPCSLGDFFAPHDIWVDGDGIIYVAEVNWSAGGKHGVVPADCPSIRKYVPYRANPT